MSHIPVMLSEVIEALSPRDGGTYVDGTFGAGGYSRAILGSAACRVIGIDRDPEAERRAQGLASEGRFKFLQGCFGDVENLLDAAGEDGVDGFVLDLGVSSMQLDTAERGFSFRFDGALDMRMGTNENTQTAADVVNGWAEEDLEQIIREYGQERHARRVASEIVRARAEDGPIRTTGRLASIVRRVVRKSPNDSIDPATRTFQAIRIAVNDELGELNRALAASERILKRDGRLAVVSFHSLEDGIVKSFIAERSGKAAAVSRHMPDLRETGPAATFATPVRKAVAASKDEAAANPRSRSAKLRWAVRTAAPSWPAREANVREVRR